MTEKVKPWLDTTQKPYDWPMLRAGELTVIWTDNRNSMLGHMAAEEIMKRITHGKLLVREVQK